MALLIFQSDRFVSRNRSRYGTVQTRTVRTLPFPSSAGTPSRRMSCTQTGLIHAPFTVARYGPLEYAPPESAPSEPFLLRPALRYAISENELGKDAAYQVIADHLQMDGKPRLNLASFVTTWMEPECDKLLTEAFNKNLADLDEYPASAELEVRCRGPDG